MRRRSRSLWICLALLGALPAPAVYAQPDVPSEEAKNAARAAADKGQALYNAGKYREALDAFREAERQFSAPTIRLMLARTYEKMGRLIEARDIYKTVVGWKLAHYAPRAFFEAQAQAKQELPALMQRIPTLQVTVTGAPATAVQLTVDGLPAAAGQALQFDPGEHTVTASVTGGRQETQRVTLKEGGNAQVTLWLQESPPAAAAQRAPSGPGAPAGAPADATPGPARGYVGPAIAAFGVAGLALGVGTVTGLMSLGKAGSLGEECLGATCYDDAGGDTYDSARTLGTASTVSFVVGGVAAATGVVLLLWPRDGEGAQVGLTVRPGWAGVRGTF